MMTPKHELKCWPEPYEAVVTGQKRHEIRGDDRFFQVGDLVLLREFRPPQWNRQGAYTGRTQIVRVTYVSRAPAWGLPDGMVILSIECIEDRPSVFINVDEVKAGFSHELEKSRGRI